MLHVLTKDGKKLFSGTKHQVKQFLRKNKVKNYVLKERFVEAKPAIEPVKKVYHEESSFNPDTPEGDFNLIFEENE